VSQARLTLEVLSEGPACQVRFSEGRARRVRRAMLDYPALFGGRDKHAPPNGHDKHAPPTNPTRTLLTAASIALRGKHSK